VDQTQKGKETWSSLVRLPRRYGHLAHRQIGLQGESAKAGQIDTVTASPTCMQVMKWPLQVFVLLLLPALADF
jgi:hypothetical protein